MFQLITDAYEFISSYYTEGRFAALIMLLATITGYLVIKVWKLSGATNAIHR